MSLKIGEAFDVTVLPTLVSSENLSNIKTDYEMLFDLRNASKKDVTVRLFQSLRGTRYDYKFMSESQTGTALHDSQRYWDVDIPAEGSSQLTFKVREDRR